jgi:hypothetical protein
MPKPKPRATAPWTHSSAPQTPRSGSVVRSRAFAFMLSTITICSGRHESRSTSRAESTRGGDRAQMQSRRRQAPTCTQSLHTCPIRFQDPAQNEPLLNLAEGSSTPGWRTPAEMSKTARPTSVTSSVTSTPQRRDGPGQYVIPWIMARKNARGTNWDGRPLDGHLRSSPVRSPEGLKPTPKAHASFAIIEQVKAMLDRCRSLIWMESLELRIRAPHGRRRGSCFGCRSLSFWRNPLHKRGLIR